MFQFRVSSRKILTAGDVAGLTIIFLCPAVCHLTQLAVLDAVLRALSLPTELLGFPGREMYRHQSRQYLETVSLIPLWEMAHTISVSETEGGRSQNTCVAEARPGGDGRWYEPLSSPVSVL